MIERRCLKPFLVLVFAAILTLFVVAYYLKPASLDQKTKTKTSAVIMPVVKNYPGQVIRIMTSDCSIKSFDYQDPRVLTSHDLSDVETEVESNDTGVSKMVTLKRLYLGDASIDFRLKGAMGREGSFRIANTKGSSTTYYCFTVKFSRSDTADVVVLIRASQITTIYQESPRLMTFFQYTGAI